MELHALIYIISISLFCLPSIAIDITWTTLPFAKPDGLCCFRTAFDNNTGFVWLLGGYGFDDIYKWNYLSSYQSFTRMGSLSDSTYGSWGQDWVNKDNIIYYVDAMEPFIYSFDITSAMEIANDLNASFPFRASNPCVTTDDDAYLIIVGGGYDVNAISTRIYNFETGAWLSNTPNLNEGRTSHSCNVYSGYIYAIGGWNFNNHETKTVERLNLNEPSSSNWITLDHQLNTARYQHRSVLINDFIIVTGGNNNGVSLKSVEIISMVDDSITPGTDLNIGVFAHGIVRGPMNNVIIIGGGTSGSSYETNTIQVSNAFAITDPNIETTGDPNAEPKADSTTTTAEATTAAPYTTEAATRTTAEDTKTTTEAAETTTSSGGGICDKEDVNDLRPSFDNSESTTHGFGWCKFCVCRSLGHPQCERLVNLYLEASEETIQIFNDLCDAADYVDLQDANGEQCDFGDVRVKDEDDIENCWCDALYCNDNLLYDPRSGSRSIGNQVTMLCIGFMIGFFWWM